MNFNLTGKENHIGRVLRSKSELRCCSTKERGIHTAMEQAKRKKMKEFKLVSRPILPQQAKNSHIIHHQSEDKMEGSVLILPIKTSQSVHPSKERPFGFFREDQDRFKSGNTGEREKSQHWKAFSRKNIHILNSKLKQIRCSNYCSQPHFNSEDVDSSAIEQLRIRAGSFQCRTLDPILGTSSNVILLKKNFQENIQNQRENLHKINKEHYKKLLINQQAIRERSQSSTGNEFFTKLKKKCLQKDPHLLATVIKHKSEKNAKEDLYEFVTKIITKSKKN